MARITTIIGLSFILSCAPYSTYLQDDTSTNSNYFKDGIPSDAYLEKDRWESDRTNIKSESGVTVTGEWCQILNSELKVCRKHI